MKIIRFLILLIIVIGAINWGLWGIFQYDIIADIFNGDASTVARWVYSIIGICGVISIFCFLPNHICKCQKRAKRAKK